MRLMVFLYASLALLFGRYTYNCMKLIPAQPRVTYINEKYVENVRATVRRYSRRSDYVFNLEFENKVILGDNVSIHLIFYEYLHNEYRRSFIEIEFKLCDLIFKDRYLSSIINKGGIMVCPLPPGKKVLANMTYNQEIPSVWPFEKGRAELIATFIPKGEIIGKGDLVLTFIQKIKSSG